MTITLHASYIVELLAGAFLLVRIGYLIAEKRFKKLLEEEHIQNVQIASRNRQLNETLRQWVNLNTTKQEQS